MKYYLQGRKGGKLYWFTPRCIITCRQAWRCDQPMVVVCLLACLRVTSMVTSAQSWTCSSLLVVPANQGPCCWLTLLLGTRQQTVLKTVASPQYEHCLRAFMKWLCWCSAGVTEWMLLFLSAGTSTCGIDALIACNMKASKLYTLQEVLALAAESEHIDYRAC